MSLPKGRARSIPYICSAGQVLPRYKPSAMSTEGTSEPSTSKSTPVSVPDAVSTSSASTSSTTTTTNRRRSHTDGNYTQTLRFLERTDRSAYRSSPSLSITPYPVGYTAPQSPARPSVLTVRGPRNPPLAFLERVPSRLSASISTTSLINGAGVETGFESLHEGALAESFDRRTRLGDDDFRDSDYWDEEDDNVCPSIICSCFPCLVFLWPQKQGRHRQFVVSKTTPTSRLQSNLNTPLLGDEGALTSQPEPASFPKDIKLIEVEVQSAKNVPSAEAAGMGDFGVLVGLRMTPVQEGVGEQGEQTSLSPQPLNPRWGAQETFTFFVIDSSNKNTRPFLQLYLLYRPLRPPPPPSPSHSLGSVPENGNRPGDIPVGEGFVDVMGLFPVHDVTYTSNGPKGNSRKVTVPMRDPVGKRRLKCSVMLALRCRRVNETIDTLEDRLYEYQRWTNIAGWGLSRTSHEGRWSTVDGTSVNNSFIEVAPPAGHDSQVVLPWCPFGGWEYSRVEHWETLGIALKDAVWTEGYMSGAHATRRRLWRRIFLENATSTSPSQETKS